MVAVLIYMLHKNNIPVPNNCSGSEGNTFNDIEGSPYKIYLMEAGNNCIIAGTSAHVFSPNDEINRGQIATLVSRLLSRENSKHDCVEPDVPPFSDFDKKDANYYRRIDAVLTRECTK